MSINNLDKIFKPKSIAVIGASNTEGSIGSAIFRGNKGVLNHEWGIAKDIMSRFPN